MDKLAPLSIVALLALALASAAGHARAEDAADVPDEYLIGVEDVLRIVTWGEKDLTLTAKVRPDGRISLPLVNEVLAAGRTPDQVRQQITEDLTAFIKAPNVTVIVEEINSFRVYFLGEIQTRGPQQFYRPTRMLQGIATAGGLTAFAKKEITVVREEHGIEKRIELDYKKLLAGDPSQQNIRLKPGDTVLVK